MTFSHRGVNAVVQVACPAVMFTCTVYPIGHDRVRVIFDTPLKAVTPGQAAVFYDGDVVLGGGRISRPDAAAQPDRAGPRASSPELRASA